MGCVEKLTVKKLRDLGATKLADAAEGTINRLREIGAPDISEDRVIRSIMKEAAKSNATRANLSLRNIVKFGHTTYVAGQSPLPMGSCHPYP